MPVSVNRKALIRALESVIPFPSREGHRWGLNGIFTTTDNGVLVLAGTDGHTLNETRIPCSTTGEAALDVDTLLSVDGAKKVIAAMKAINTSTVDAVDVLSGGRIDGVFPDYKVIFPPDSARSWYPSSDAFVKIRALVQRENKARKLPVDDLRAKKRKIVAEHKILIGAAHNAWREAVELGKTATKSEKRAARTTSKDARQVKQRAVDSKAAAIVDVDCEIEGAVRPLYVQIQVTNGEMRATYNGETVSTGGVEGESEVPLFAIDPKYLTRAVRALDAPAGLVCMTMRSPLEPIGFSTGGSTHAVVMPARIS